MTALLDPPVADLQARVAALEQALARVGSPETLQPNYLTVDPAGNVGANFSGRIHAQGIDLPSAPSTTPDAINTIRWLTQPDGSFVADLFGFQNGNLTGLFGEAIAQPGPNEGAQAALLALDNAQLRGARLVVNSDPTFDANVTAQVAAVTATKSQTKTLLDPSGNSDFLQLAVTSQRAVDAGVTSVTWGGASTISGAVAVAHGLGRAPAAVLVACRVRSDGGVSYAVYSGVSSSSLTLQAIAPAAPAAGVTCNVSWLVIG